MPMLHSPANLPDLAAIRQTKGIRLDKIAETTKISIRYLRAIESGDFKQLPGGVFATSYIRQYAEAIDYDAWDLLACYHSVVPPEDNLPDVPEEPKRGGLPAFLRFLASVL